MPLDLLPKREEMEVEVFEVPNLPLSAKIGVWHHALYAKEINQLTF